MLRKVRPIKLDRAAYRRLMKRVLDRDGWRCQKCGAVKDLQVHHRQYRSRLGGDKLDNLVTLCAYCHMEEHGQLAYSKAAILQMRVRATRQGFGPGERVRDFCRVER